MISLTDISWLCNFLFLVFLFLFIKHDILLVPTHPIIRYFISLGFALNSVRYYFVSDERKHSQWKPHARFSSVQWKGDFIQILKSPIYRCLFVQFMQFDYS